MSLPTIKTICTEALRQAGRGRTIDPDDLDRAQTKWYEEIMVDILSRREWKQASSTTINSLRTALTRGVKWKALLDVSDTDSSRAETDYERSIRKLIRVDNRNFVKRKYVNQGGGMPL